MSMERFSKIWQSNGTTQKIPESNIKYIEGYRFTDKYPDYYILNYIIENFRIYVNDFEYFLSKLPKLNITTSHISAE